MGHWVQFLPPSNIFLIFLVSLMCRLAVEYTGKSKLFIQFSKRKSNQNMCRNCLDLFGILVRIVQLSEDYKSEFLKWISAISVQSLADLNHGDASPF